MGTFIACIVNHRPQVGTSKTWVDHGTVCPCRRVFLRVHEVPIRVLCGGTLRDGIPRSTEKG